MQSIVVFLVEHGDTTDPLVEFIDNARVHCEDYDLQVDVVEGEEFTLHYTGETVYLRRD